MKKLARGFDDMRIDGGWIAGDSSREYCRVLERAPLLANRDYRA